ncbi:MAG: universal stress protein [Gammaproteobacteria bacterium]|nr:universal stress protein [Gammaproteobacteria bacterium]MBU1415617.1 universal stress protein [Gammaproteobacteria bacterium]
MLKTLLPIDGSEASLRAVEYVIRLYNSCQNGQIVLINVQPPVDSWELKSHLRPAEIEAMQETRGGDALVSAREMLDRAHVPYETAVLLGKVAESIVACAQENACEQIIMGNKGESFLEEAVTGSVAHDVLRLSPLPVTYVK